MNLANAMSARDLKTYAFRSDDIQHLGPSEAHPLGLLELCLIWCLFW